MPLCTVHSSHPRKRSNLTDIVLLINNNNNNNNKNNNNYNNNNNNNDNNNNKKLFDRCLVLCYSDYCCTKILICFYDLQFTLKNSPTQQNAYSFPMLVEHHDYSKF